MTKIIKLPSRKKKGDIITIDGIKHRVLRSRVITYKNMEREDLYVKKMKGTVVYNAVRFPNGTVSKPLSLSAFKIKESDFDYRNI